MDVDVQVMSVKEWERIDQGKRYRMQMVYVGRPSVLGNPFRVGEHGTREEVIALYRTWLREQWKQGTLVRTELLRLATLASAGPLTLVCHCSPLACHADVIADAVRKLVRKW